jgi:hypothetical protein
MKRITLFAGMAALLSGCVGPLVQVHNAETVGATPMEMGGKIAIVDAVKARTMTDLGEVTGNSCKNKIWDPAATAEAATFQTKVTAAQRGASAITGPSCS